MATTKTAKKSPPKSTAPSSRRKNGKRQGPAVPAVKLAGIYEPTLTVAEGSALGELVEVGERFAREHTTAKIWRGLVLLNLPISRAPGKDRSPHVAAALRFIQRLPRS
jgi:hypothetical protein